MKLTYAELWRAKHAECLMKLTYEELYAFIQNESLYVNNAHNYVGSYKEINDFTTKSRDGSVITGYAVLFPDVHIKDDVVVVDVHTCVFSDKGRFYSYLDSSTEPVTDWICAERMMSTNEDIIYRSVKRDIPVSRWLANTVQSWCSTTSSYIKPCGTAIQRATDSISQHMKFEGYDFKYDWLTGQAIVDRYREWNSTSHSCMTGCNCEKTRLWSTNGKQCRLLVIKDGEHEIARTLCFRPGPSIDSLSDELPFGPGWFYGRIYQVSSASSIAMGLRVTQAIAWMRQKGLVEASLRNSPGAVPLIVTEYAPYIDRGYVFAKSHDEDEQCYWTCEPDPAWLPSSRWQAIESSQHGDGFGRRMDEDEDSSICSCCDGSYNSEEMAYVEDYGDVCDDCLSGGSFTYCMDDTWRPADDVSPVYFDDISHVIGYIGSSRETISLWYNGRRHTFHRAEDQDENDVYAPKALTHKVLGLDRLYAGSIDDLVEVKHKIAFNDDGTLSCSKFDEEEPVYCLADHSVLYDDNGNSVTAYASWFRDMHVTSCVKGVQTYKSSGLCLVDGKTLCPVKYMNTLLYIDADDENRIVIKMHKRGSYGLADKSPAIDTKWDYRVPVVLLGCRRLQVGSATSINFVTAGFTLGYEHPVHDSGSFKYGCYRAGWSDLPSPFGTVIPRPGVAFSSTGPMPIIGDNQLLCRTVVSHASCNMVAFIGGGDDVITHAVIARRHGRDRYASEDPVIIPLRSTLFLDGFNQHVSIDKIGAAAAAINNLIQMTTIRLNDLNDDAVALLRTTIYTALES